MPLKFEENYDWNRLLPVLEEHGEWFMCTMQFLFYPDEETDCPDANKPTSFAQWVVDSNRSGTIQSEVIESLTTLHQDLIKKADILIHGVKASQEKPKWAEFKSFITLYEEFVNHVRRLEKDLVIEGSGYDSFTGLRSEALFLEDVKRELDRLERQGKTFCAALAKIDNFDLIRKGASKSELDGYVKLVAGLIKISIRSFDDAYYLGNDEFAVCLKQADITGGISALERLKRELEAQKIMVHIEGGVEAPLSMSCCIVEPTTKDQADDLIKNLRLDLVNSVDKDVDTILKYHELSPLQRYVQDGR